ncbi:MAG TPA: type II toxin-antitoxin system VapC family toxin [Burkholderiales bacterium]|nr:type II toxin-antitoxin system VapC family toxin [Burkholderiales bacterium]
MIVVDASAVLEVLLNTADADRVADRLFTRGETLHAPHLIDLEVAQVLRRYVRGGEVDSERALEALSDFAALQVSRYPHDFLLPRICQLRNNATAYDAGYLILAEVLDCPLVACDQALAGVPGHAAQVQVTV